MFSDNVKTLLQIKKKEKFIPKDVMKSHIDSLIDSARVIERYFIPSSNKNIILEQKFKLILKELILDNNRLIHEFENNNI